jgi:RHS repeat-associated protein
VYGTDSISALHDLSYRPNDLLAGYGLGTRLTAKESYEAQRTVLTQSVVTKSVTNDTLYLQRMSWDGAGNVAGMKRNLGDSLGFDVDHLYQLREVHYPDGQALTVGYDLNGNRTKLAHPMGKGMMDTFALNGNRVTGGSTARKGWTVYRHDSRGNLSLEASFAWVTDTGNFALAWRVVESRFNKRNELVRVRAINRMPAADTTWLRFDYGEDGNRILSAMGKGSDTSSWLVTHKWVYDGSVIAADSGSDHGWTWHAYNGLNRVAEATDSAGHTRVRYVLTDHQGTVQALLSDTGAVLGHWVWDPWGNIEESWTQRTTDLLYQGKPYETALNQYQFNARWYSPERGAYTGRDKVEQFYSPYNYVGDGPIAGVDPTGNWEANINGNPSDGYDLTVADNHRDYEVAVNVNGQQIQKIGMQDLVQEYKPDVYGVNVSVEFTAGGGGQYSWTLAWFPTDPKSAGMSVYQDVGANFGASAGAGAAPFVGYLNGPLKGKSAFSEFAGFSKQINLGAGPASGSISWSDMFKTYSLGGVVGGLPLKLGIGASFSIQDAIYMGTYVGNK